MPKLHRRHLLAAAGATLLARPALLRAATASSAPGGSAASGPAPGGIYGIGAAPLQLAAPATRILLGFYFEDFLAVGGSAALERVVGLSRAAWQDWRPANWQAYLAVLPGLAAIPDVGEVEVGTFSIEKVIALRPEVAILGEWQLRGLGGEAARLAEAGIAVVVVDYHSQTVERHLASTRLLGQVLGATERAEELCTRYAAAIGTVQARLGVAGRPRPRVYLELGNKGPAEQGVSYGDHMWGAIARLGGGDNIARGLVSNWAPIAAEQVLASRPEAIVIAGSEWRRHATGQLMGEGVTPAEARARLAGFAARPGWSALPAVREGRLHAIYQGASRTLADHASVQYLAKACYPDLFADLDPAATYLDYHARYLPIRPQGSFMLAQT